MIVIHFLLLLHYTFQVLSAVITSYWTSHFSRSEIIASSVTCSLKRSRGSLIRTEVTPLIKKNQISVNATTMLSELRVSAGTDILTLSDTLQASVAK